MSHYTQKYVIRIDLWEIGFDERKNCLNYAYSIAHAKIHYNIHICLDSDQTDFCIVLSTNRLCPFTSEIYYAFLSLTITLHTGSFFVMYYPININTNIMDDFTNARRAVTK